jgi:hypothetical protein
MALTTDHRAELVRQKLMHGTQCCGWRAGCTTLLAM